MEDFHYTTSDLGLATALHTAGFPVVTISSLDPGGRKFAFHIEDVDGLAQAEKDYWSGKLQVNAQDFFNNIKSLKNRVFEARNGGR